ncbi:hypothetical protein OIU74_014220, partial [Salix koriyanagi]
MWVSPRASLTSLILFFFLDTLDSFSILTCSNFLFFFFFSFPFAVTIVTGLLDANICSSCRRLFT